MLKIQLCITRINYSLKFIQIENGFLIVIFHCFNSSFFNVAALVSKRDFFQHIKTYPKPLNGVYKM